MFSYCPLAEWEPEIKTAFSGGSVSDSPHDIKCVDTQISQRQSTHYNTKQIIQYPAVISHSFSSLPVSTKALLLIHVIYTKRRKSLTISAIKIVTLNNSIINMTTSTLIAGVGRVSGYSQRAIIFLLMNTNAFFLWCFVTKIHDRHRVNAGKNIGCEWQDQTS